MTKKILKADYGSQHTPLVIGNLKMPCYVLEDGTRVLSGRGMQLALGFGEKESGKKLSNLLKSHHLSTFFTPALLEKFDNRIEFLRPGSGGSVPKTYGYEATLLIDICDALLSAKKEDALTQIQQSYAEQAEIIIRAVAKVGIIALIDEATGYQDVRRKDALQKILDAYLSKELSAWAKRFPDDFYDEIFRLKKWNWNIKKRPPFIGKITNDIVYSRLAPGVLEKLKEINPINDKGFRKNHHHRHLTTDVGHPALSQHIHALKILMKSATSWASFYRLLQRSLPKKNEQLSLDLKQQDQEE